MVETVAAFGLPVGERILIRKRRITGKGGEGGRFSIVSGIHGDELEGQYICYELARRLEENLEALSGIVDIYPALNPLGIDARQRNVPRTEMDLNWVFPGQKDGSVMDRLAASVVEDLIGSDLCIDLHSAETSIREMTQVRISQELKEKLLPYGMLLNTDMIWLNAVETGHESTLEHSLNMLGVPTLVLEMGLGSRIGINMDSGNRVVDGILNLMRELQIWHGPVGQIKKPVIVPDSDVCVIRAQKEGIFLPFVSHEAKIKKGEPLGRVVEVLRACVQEEITAPCDGQVFTVREYPVVYEGALLMRILMDQGAGGQQDASGQERG